MPPYAKTGEVHLRVTASAENEKACKKLIKPVVKELKKRFGENIFATDESKTLEEAVIDLLKEKDLKLSLAESLTGGMIAQRIVNVSGASDVFGYGFVTYSNKAKHKCLGVKKSTLKEKGAVSAKCAREMAKGACKESGRYQYFCNRACRTRRRNKRNSGWNCIYGLLLRRQDHCKRVPLHRKPYADP